MNTRLVCVDIQTGETLWEFAIEEDDMTILDRSEVSVEEGIYFSTEEPRVFRLDQKTGQVMWEYHPVFGTLWLFYIKDGIEEAEIAWNIGGPIAGAAMGYWLGRPQQR